MTWSAAREAALYDFDKSPMEYSDYKLQLYNGRLIGATMQEFLEERKASLRPPPFRIAGAR